MSKPVKNINELSMLIDVDGIKSSYRIWWHRRYDEHHASRFPIQQVKLIGTTSPIPIHRKKGFSGVTKVEGVPTRIKVHVFDKDFNKIQTIYSNPDGTYYIPDAYKNHHLVFESLGSECPAVTTNIQPATTNIKEPLPTTTKIR